MINQIVLAIMILASLNLLSVIVCEICPSLYIQKTFLFNLALSGIGNEPSQAFMVARCQDLMSPIKTFQYIFSPVFYLISQPGNHACTLSLYYGKSADELKTL